MPLMQDFPLLNSTTGHYNSTGTHSTSLWLAFLTNNGELWKVASQHSTTQVHIAMPPENIPVASKIQMHIMNMQW